MSRQCALAMALIVVWVMAWMLNSAHAGGYTTTPSGRVLFYPQARDESVRQYFDTSGQPVGYGVRNHDDMMILFPFNGSAIEVWRDKQN